MLICIIYIYIYRLTQHLHRRHPLGVDQAALVQRGRQQRDRVRGHESDVGVEQEGGGRGVRLRETVHPSAPDQRGVQVRGVQDQGRQVAEAVDRVALHVVLSAHDDLPGLLLPPGLRQEFPGPVR